MHEKCQITAISWHERKKQISITSFVVCLCYFHVVVAATVHQDSTWQADISVGLHERTVRTEAWVFPAM